MEFYTGEAYPHMCRKCRGAIDRSVGFVILEGDTDDKEAPLMMASDLGFLCGGNECDIAGMDEVEQDRLLAKKSQQLRRYFQAQRHNEEEGNAKT